MSITKDQFIERVREIIEDWKECSDGPIRVSGDDFVQDIADLLEQLNV